MRVASGCFFSKRVPHIPCHPALTVGLLSFFLVRFCFLDQFGSTALHLSCFSGHEDCVQQLLQLPHIQLNCQDVFNRTPVRVLAACASACIRVLIPCSPLGLLRSTQWTHS